MIITSRSNETFRRIRKLSNRSEREERGVAFVEGVRIVAEAIQLGAGIADIVVAPNLLKSPFAYDLIRKQAAAGVPVVELSGDLFRNLSVRDRPQGFGAVIEQRWERLDAITPGERDELCWVILEAVQDPGNLGTILRTSEAAGGAGVILLGSATDPYDPGAIRASMGAIFSQRLARTNRSDLASWAERHSLRIIGALPDAPQDYQAVDYQSEDGAPPAILMGSERQGLSSELQALCDEQVHIPMVGRADSLNLSVATALMLYEAFNQRRRGKL